MELVSTQASYSENNMPVSEKHFIILFLWGRTYDPRLSSEIARGITISDSCCNSTKTGFISDQPIDIKLAIKSTIKHKYFIFEKFQEHNKGLLLDKAFKFVHSHNVVFSLLDYQKHKSRKIGKSCREYKKFNNIIWASLLPKKIIAKIVVIEAKNMIIFDEDIVFESEFIQLIAPNIVVIPCSKSFIHEFKITIRINGEKNTRIIFDKTLVNMVNADKLCVEFKNNLPDFNLYFPLPESVEFKKDCKNIRVESLLINNLWTEHASYNNRYLDLIVHWEPEFGKIYIDESWKIEKNNFLVYGKFHINECMRSKNSIRKRYKSLKDFRNVREYLENSEIEGITDELVKNLERFVLCVPSIFELFMYRFKEFEAYSKDFKKIKKMLLKRYIQFLRDLKKGIHRHRFDSEGCLSNVDQFLHSIDTHWLDKGLENVIYRYLDRVGIAGHEAELYCFFSPYLILIKNMPEKTLLYENKLSGDVSMLLEDYEASERSSTLQTAGAITLGNVVIQGSMIAIKQTTKAAVNHGTKEVVKTGVKASCTRIALTAFKGISIPLTLGLNVAEVAINIAALKINSGYYNGVLEL